MNSTKGDQIQVRRNGRVFTYEVTGKRIVQPEDVSVIKQTTDPQLTLITCYPTYYIGPAPKRLVVFSRLMESDGQPSKQAQAQTDSSRSIAPSFYNGRVNSWDVIIVGAGIIGVSLALELRERGATVLVLDRGEPGAEASSAAAGMLAASDPETPPALRPLALESARMFPEYVARLEELSRRMQT